MLSQFPDQYFKDDVANFDPETHGNQNSQEPYGYLLYIQVCTRALIFIQPPTSAAAITLIIITTSFPASNRLRPSAGVPQREATVRLEGANLVFVEQSDHSSLQYGNIVVADFTAHRLHSVVR